MKPDRHKCDAERFAAVIHWLVDHTDPDGTSMPDEIKRAFNDALENWSCPACASGWVI